MALTAALAGTGVAVGFGVAVGGSSVGGGAGFDDTGRLAVIAIPASEVKSAGEARPVAGNWVSARSTTTSGTSKAAPRMKRSEPPPVDRLCILGARIGIESQYADGVPGTGFQE